MFYLIRAFWRRTIYAPDEPVQNKQPYKPAPCIAYFYCRTQCHPSSYEHTGILRFLQQHRVLSEENILEEDYL